VSLLRSVIRELRGAERDAAFWSPGSRYATYAGLAVTQETAMTCSAVYAAVSLISETIATLPVDVVQRYADGSRYARPKPIWMNSPNEAIGLDWPGLVQQTMTSLLLDGNAFIGVARDAQRQPVALWPLDPQRVTVELDYQRGVVRYFAAARDGRAELERADLLHIRGLTMPGQLRGLSPVEQARQSLGRTLAAERFGATMFRRLAAPGVVITSDKVVTEEQARALAERFDAAHAGSENSFRTVVLGSGAQLHTVTLTPEQVQMIETMRYGVLDVARWYRIPPYMLDPSVSSTWGSGIAEQSIQTVQYMLAPWTVRLQHAFERLLYETYLDQSYTARFDFRAFLRADPEKQAKYLEAKLRCRAMVPNDWRALDDENPLPDGGEPLWSVQWQR